MPGKRRSTTLNREQTQHVQTEQPPPSLPPEAGLPKSSAELEHLTWKRITIFLENFGDGNGHDGSSHVDLGGPRNICGYKDFMNLKPKDSMEMKEL